MIIKPQLAQTDDWPEVSNTVVGDPVIDPNPIADYCTTRQEALGALESLEEKPGTAHAMKYTRE